MITSPRYIALNAAREKFSEKMNFSGSPLHFNTAKLRLNWIQNNLSLTSFSDYNAALTDWNKIVGENKKVIQENILFFKRLQIMQNPKQAYINLTDAALAVNGDDPCGCQATYVADMTAQAKAYAAQIAQSFQLCNFADFNSIDSTMEAVNNIEASNADAIACISGNLRMCIYQCS